VRAVPFVWQLGSQLVTYDGSADDPDDVQWRKVVFTFTRATPAFTAEDTAQFAFHIANITGGDLDTTWTTTDYTNCETALNAFWSSIKVDIDLDFVLVDYRWYVMSFKNPLEQNKRFNNSGPPARVLVKGEAGTKASVSLPYQTAMSMTLRTSVPRHWGRVYIPGYTTSALTTVGGRWNTTEQQRLAHAGAELVDALGDADFQLFVPVTQVDKVLQPAMLGVTQVVVDDIPDVIRRRRPKQPASRFVGVAT